ncbi:MAG TPA: T9SS type A sorting domain-containing protein, partial [Bacteroidetes bacterium]|nr:T9SS type A sorting domain-containing protein [Bacteroidota bacterium]
LINKLCEVAPVGFPCSNGLNKFDTLPSGYFWVQEGGSPDCDASNCSPSRKYGIGTPVVDITWDFTMRVKEFDEPEGCIDCSDLSIVFQTFSDGAAGCWDDPVGECLIDKPQFSPNWQISCDIAPKAVIEYSFQQICDETETEILVYTADGSQNTIDVSYNDNPNVTGEKEHTFYQGSGTIYDTLSIVDSFACKPEIVTYYAQVFDNSNICGSEMDTIVVTVYPKPVFEIHKTDIKYGGDSLGSAYVSLYCSDSLYSYLWSTGDTLDSISGLSEGVYFVTVTNEYGCSKTDSIFIENIICGDVIYDKTDMNCYGECLGSIQIENVENGIPPYSYIWSTGDTTAMIDSLCAGMYFVTVTGLDSCSSVDSIEIISPLAFNLVTDLADAKCYGECNGAILINEVENAVKPVSYLWDSGDATSYRLNICAGNYYVTVTDSIGCYHVHTFVINEPDEISITIDSTRDVRATPLGYIAITGRENYFYNWTGPDGFESDNQSIFGLNKAGCYTLTVTDTLTNCTVDTTICISDKTGTLEEYDGFNVNIYPNPADDIIYFDLKNNDISRVDVKIYNIAGVEMNKFQITKDKTIYPMNTQNFSQGLYIYKISTEKGVKVGTFIINR